MVFFMFKTRFSYLHKIRWNCGQFPLFLSPPHSSDLISETKYLPATDLPIIALKVRINLSWRPLVSTEGKIIIARSVIIIITEIVSLEI